ncbi:MAG: hypothetical protein MUC81_02145 [Bacteroidia bacterium]|nr:hypothetical protein [Bacteroidia bacterium]
MIKKTNKLLYLSSLVIFMFLTHVVKASDTTVIKGSYKPFLLPSHPLAQFIGYVQHNFRTAPVQKITLHAGLNNANIWQPKVLGYLPHDAKVTQLLSQFPWHKRDSIFQGFPQQYDSTVYAADGVTRTLYVHTRIRLSKRDEMEVGFKGVLFSGGSLPTAFVTSDEFIEWFHSNIAGGKDPFARKRYNLNDAYLYYKDREGREINLSKNAFIIPGIQLHYYRYCHHQKLSKRNIQLGFGVHTSFNTTSFNRSFDGGISTNIQKQFKYGAKHYFTLGASVGVLQQKIITLKQSVDFSRNHTLKSVEAIFEYRKMLHAEKFRSLGLHFNYIDPYHPAREFDNITPVGNRLTSHWHLGLTHLYRNSQYWSLIYTLGNQWIWSIYILEDFKVNNAPDIQTGISVEIPL